MITEEEKRDAALAVLSATRASIIKRARSIAIQIARAEGEVHSSQVIQILRDEGFDPDRFDKRFMGVVFQRGWERVGYRNEGSHARPISVWRRRLRSIHEPEPEAGSTELEAVRQENAQLRKMLRLLNSRYKKLLVKVYPAK